MIDKKRLGLGCMGMNLDNKNRAIDTVRAALDEGITLFNTGEFYGNGASEMVLGEALRGVRRDSCFVSVKFGMLPKPEGGHYGIDVNPWHVKARLAYSLKRLNLDYIDLYEPARLDESVPLEDLLGAMQELVQAGYVRYIGLSEVDADTLRRAVKICPIHTVEVQYSLASRGIEKELIPTARELGVNVLAFGALSHGLISEALLEDQGSRSVPSSIFSPENLEHNRRLVRALKVIADEKGTTVSKLALAWTLSKYSELSSLIGTTSVEHLKDSIDALSMNLSEEDIPRIEAAFPEGSVRGFGMRKMQFVDGRVIF